SSQPIALPANIDDSQLANNAGSYGPASGPFNPASYTRAFFGSPISWRAGSFGSRFYPGSSPGQLLGPLDPTDLRSGKMSSSIESDRGSILNALSEMQREDEFCKNYTCCGLNLQDLHALVDHFEEVHVVVVDPYTQQLQSHPQQTPHPQNHQHIVQSPYASQPKVESYFPQHAQQNQHTQQLGSFDPDDMELDLDSSPTSSSTSSPPQTPVTTFTGHAYNMNSSYTPLTSACPSPVSAFDTTAVLPSRVAAFPPPPMRTPPEDVFNAYAGYSDYSAGMPGTRHVMTEDLGAGTNSVATSQPSSPYGCVPPALLYSTSTTPANTPSGSRVASPAQYQPLSAHASSSTSGVAASSNPTTPTQPASPTARASTTLSRPASSLLLSKPFRCPKPNCNKSYKQANGLKYHMTHGSCNFAPPKDLEALQALLAEKGVGVGANGEQGRGMSEGELREVEREAERRLRPFACGVGECQRRYKNMNGLRYHYQHSGDHGAIGLQLLASGQHECLQHTSAAKSRAPTPASHNNTAVQQQQP
ncbi:hypothetical protein BV25DRAFT_1784788, partial [Artomyces pyxidatus]